MKSVGKTLSFAPCNDEFYFWNHPTVHIRGEGGYTYLLPVRDIPPPSCIQVSYAGKFTFREGA